MQANSWHYKLFHFCCPFESGKCGNEKKKHFTKTKTVINYKTLNISRMKKAF